MAYCILDFRVPEELGGQASTPPLQFAMAFVVTIILSILGASVGAFIFLSVWYFVLRPLLTARHYWSQGLRVTRFLPVVGDLAELIRHRENLHDAFYKTFEIWRERYGSTYVFFFGSDVRIMLHEPDVC